jgi:hypothetical protein
MELYVGKVNHIGLKSAEDFLKEKIIITKNLDIVPIAITAIIAEVSLGRVMQRDVKEKNCVHGRGRHIVIVTVHGDRKYFIERCRK